jgi:hypothetical protein
MGKLKLREDEYVALNKDILDKESRKAYRAKEKKKRLWILVLGLIFNFGMLAVMKYTAFAITNVNSLLTLFGARTIDVPNLFLVLGISYFVFQSTGYLIDVYRGKTAAEKNLARFALFVAFFPQLALGPISRHAELSPELYAPHSFDGKKLKFGIQRVLWGFFKKLGGGFFGNFNIAEQDKGSDVHLIIHGEHRKLAFAARNRHLIAIHC